METPLASLAHFPMQETMSKAVRRVHRKLNPAPLPPHSRRDFNLDDYPKYKKTMRGDEFLIYDSGPDDPNRIIIYGTEEGLQLLLENLYWASYFICRIKKIKVVYMYVVTYQ